MASRYLSENDCNNRLLSIYPPLTRMAPTPSASKKLITHSEAWDYDIYNIDYNTNTQYLTEDEFISPFVYFDLEGIHPLTYICNYTYSNGSIPSLIAKYGTFDWDGDIYDNLTYTYTGDIRVIKSADANVLRVQPGGNNRNTEVTYTGNIKVYMPNGSEVVSNLNITFHRHTTSQGSSIVYKPVTVTMRNYSTNIGLYVIQVEFAAYYNGSEIDTELWTGDHPDEGNSNTHQSIVQTDNTNNWPAGTGYSVNPDMAINFTYYQSNRNVYIHAKKVTVILCDDGEDQNTGHTYEYTYSWGSGWYANYGGNNNDIRAGKYSSSTYQPINYNDVASGTSIYYIIWDPTWN